MINASKTLFWYANVHQKMKEPAGRIMFTHAPLCHDINQHTCRHDRMDVVVGLLSGDIVWMDPIQYRCSRMNKNGMVTSSPVRQIRWVPGHETQFVSAHSDGTVLVWDVERDDPPEGFQKAPSDPAWDPRASIVVEEPQLQTDSPSGGMLKMGRSKDHSPVLYNPLSVWHVSRRAITDMAFSPDGRTLAFTSEDKLLHIVDFSRKTLIHTMASYFGGLTCVCWSQDGRILLTGGQDDLLTIWAAKEGHVVARAQGHHSYVSAVAFDPWCHKGSSYDAYRLISAGEDGKVCFWDFSSWSLHRPRAAPNQRGWTPSTTASQVFVPAQSRAEVPMLHPTAAFHMRTSVPCGLRIAPSYIIVLHLDSEMALFSRPRRFTHGNAVDHEPVPTHTTTSSPEEPLAASELPRSPTQRQMFRRTMSPFTLGLRKT